MHPPSALRQSPWLFENHAGLAGLAWTPLVKAPTPVQRLDRVGSTLGREIWIKRDDLTSDDYGGNKPRKLEFILGDALAKGKNTLYTGGGIGTNHGLATALYGRKLGFDVVLCLFDQPVTEHVRKCLRLYHACGAEIVPAGSLARFVLRYYLIDRVRRAGAYFVYPGGSSPVGVLGYVDAALELARQIEAGEMPLPGAIFVPAGTCGTSAGLLLGLRMAGLDTEVVGVKVASNISANPKATLNLVRGTQALMRRYDPSVPALDFRLEDVRMDLDHFGPGYGWPTDAGRAGRALMADAEGIDLDLTYTAKAFAALLDRARKAGDDRPLLFWNTFNSIDLTALARDVDYQDLPRALHRCFTCELTD
ncbi:MAG: pyridoxal-phosphate dependent enzyme [Proteobacteria bacterium]|nr:pyridoxal-phosphate dependent enzyme [Pseudomonadota bacterium]